MRYLTLISLALLTACGSSTAPEDLEPEVMDVIGGNFQQAQVTERLPNPLQVKLLSASGTPVPGVVVCWVADTEGAGEPFVPCAETDDLGDAETPWTFGTVAGDHAVESRAVVDGVPTVFSTFELKATPGELDGWDLGKHTLTPQPEPGDTVDIAEDAIMDAVDEFGNAIPTDSLPRLYPDVTWEWVDRCASGTGRSSGPSGSGWTVVVIDPGPLGYETCRDTYTLSVDLTLTPLPNDPFRLFIEVQP